MGSQRVGRDSATEQQNTCPQMLWNRKTYFEKTKGTSKESYCIIVTIKMFLPEVLKKNQFLNVLYDYKINGTSIFSNFLL